jgi:hypothetical protein
MSAQILDTFIYKGEKHDLIDIEGGDLVIPARYGIETEMMHTACYRGFYANYELTKGLLYLRKITIHVKDGIYPVIGGISPVIEDDFCAVYDGLKELVTFSGKIRIAKGFIPKRYVHMGYQDASAYEVVCDIMLNNGQVTDEQDCSVGMV